MKPKQQEPTEVSESDIWRSIPPEEKFELMARAQASGVTACVITVIIASTIAVGLKFAWMLWGSLLVSPFIFQFSAGKRWRDIKPRVMLEYLAARSAARRFAFTSKSNDLVLKFMFRGKVEEVFGEEHMHQELEAMLENAIEAEVWVALFGDCVVMMQERLGGAVLKMGHLLDDKLYIEARSADSKGEYSASRELLLSYTPRDEQMKKFRLTSRYPAALIVFERQMLALKEARKNNPPSILDSLPVGVQEDDDDSGAMDGVFGA